jgi:ABC-type transporter Mla subunit MlaD
MLTQWIERLKTFRISAKQAADFWLVVIPVRRLVIGLLSEVVLWSSIVFLAVYSTAVFAEWLKLPTLLPKQTITVYFDDVSQLAVGSPVRFMGVDAGYVTAVVPEGDRVKVEAQLERLALPIPKGSHFTIEFNALAGAKSLEVLPPGSPVVGNWRESSVEGYRVQQPIRLQDVYNTQLLVSEGIVKSMENIDLYIAQLEAGLPLQERVAKVNDTLLHYQHDFTQAGNRLGQVQSVFHQGFGDVSVQLNGLNKTINDDLGWVNGVWQTWPERLKNAQASTEHMESFVGNTTAHRQRAQQLKTFGQQQEKTLHWLDKTLPALKKVEPQETP